MIHGTTNGYSNHQCRCDDCTEAWRLYSAARRIAHPEWEAKSGRNWRAKHPEAGKLRAHNWRKKNSEKNKEQQKAWRLAHPDKRVEEVRRWREKNPELLAAQSARALARHRGVTVRDLTLDQWRSIKAAYGGCCAYCGKAGPMSQDHVLAVSLGGAHTASNVVPACRSCNSTKNARSIEEWYGFLIIRQYRALEAVSC